MGPLIGSALIGGVSSLFGSLLGNHSQNQANKANMELAKYQAQQNERLQQNAFNQNKQMWDLNNQYNSPTAQMGRLQSAGLNPNLVYGTGTVGNSSGAIPQMKASSYEAPRIQPYTGWNLGLSDAVGTYMQAKSNQANVNLTNTQRDMVKAQADTEKLKQANLAIKNSMDDYSYNLAKKLQDSVLKKASSDANSSYYDSLSKSYPHSIYRDEDHGMNVGQASVKRSLDLLGSQIEMNALERRKVAAAIDGLLINNDINRFNNELYKSTGLRPGDKIYVRLIRSILGNSTLGNSLDSLFKP